MGALIAAAAAAAAQTGSSLINAYTQSKEAEKSENAADSAASTLASTWDDIAKAYSENQSDIDNYSDKVSSVYNDEDVNSATSKYSKLLNEDTSDLSYTPTDFDYNSTIDDFYTKAWDLNNQAQLTALQNSAASAGNLYSSGLTNNLASTASANATNAYKEALDAYETDYNNKENTWEAENTNAYNSANLNLNAYNDQLSALSDYLNNYLTQESNITSSNIANNSNEASAYTDYTGNLATLLAQGTGNSGVTASSLY